MPRDKALKAARHNPSTLTDLSNLQSINEKEDSLEGDAKKEAEKRKSRDAAMTVKTGLKSWNARTVRAFLVWYCCGKRWCTYSAKDAQYDITKTALLQKLESVSGCFSCGDLLFAGDHYFLSRKEPDV